MRKPSALMIGLTMSLMVPAISISAADPAKISEKDFGLLSADGMSAFEDIHMARLAIYDGNKEEAAKFVLDAKESLARAKTDGAGFLKAEAALHKPTDFAVKQNSQAEKGVEPVVWIPIDSRIDVGNSFEPTAENAAALVTAKKTLMRGEGPQALKLVKSAALDIDYTLAVAPLASSIKDVDLASQQIASGDYFGASQSLRHAEAAIRFDEVDDVANVKSGRASHDGK
jgi:hypothetical protein